MGKLPGKMILQFKLEIMKSFVRMDPLKSSVPKWFINFKRIFVRFIGINLQP